jgi:hypothetical protein
MKKLIIFLSLSLILFSVPAYSQVDSSKLTALKIYEDVKAGVSGLAKSLKVPAEHVYTVLVRQQIVHSCVWLILLIIAGLMLLFFSKGSRNKEERWINDDGGPEAIIFLRIFQILCGIILFVASVVNIDTIFTGFINPEYGAIKDIISFIR